MLTRSLITRFKFVAGVLLTLALLTPCPGFTAEKKAKIYSIKGLVTAIGPREVTVHGQKGTEVTVRTEEDFTRKVALGAQVTAWYYQEAEGFRLKWLEYPLETSNVSPHQFVPQIKRVVLLPSSDAGDADELYGTIEEFLKSNVGWTFKHRMLAEEIQSRLQPKTSALEAIDPETGEVDLNHYAELHEKLVRRIASDVRVDAVLETKIEQVRANFRSQVAVWDGTRQPVASNGSRALMLFSPLPADGHVPAATVVQNLWDPEGRLLWSSRRGFCVLALQLGITAKFRDRPLAEALMDKASIQEWLKNFYATWLPGDADLPKPK